MSDYDFRTLNDKDFEIFCADVIGEELKHRFERFKAGKDGGVDGRFYKDPQSEVILQCKHWVNTPLTQLISKLKSDEHPKLLKLNPSRYIFCTSKSLSKKDKDKILNALSPFIKSPSDIYGLEDLNDLIKAKPHIEQKHYKLWLCSSNVLIHLNNKAIFERSNFTISEALDFAKVYVPTSNHNKALEKLNTLSVVIVTGEPGIGKTTLAEHLCLKYVTEGYQLFKIADDLKEAESVFAVDQKQIFYFDDFLGRNYLEALTGNQGSHIVQFIQRVSKTKDKKFILTSRSTILNQGKLLIDLFQNNKVTRNEFELKFTSLSSVDKAHILYNHIWHSNLPPDHVEELYKDKRYKKIIQHRNFNPRLISYITDSDRFVDQHSSEYWEYIKTTLDDPSGVWDNPFIAQQDDFGRAITLLVTLHGKAISQDELSEAYSRYLARPENVSMNGRRDFLYNLSHLTGSLLNRKIDGKRAVIDLFNPSIGDYVLRRYSSDIPSLKNAFLNLRSESSFKTLYNLKENKFINLSSYKEILGKILSEALATNLEGYTTKYLTAGLLGFMLIPNLSNNDDDLIKNLIQHLFEMDNSDSFYGFSRIVTLSVEQGKISSAKAIKLIGEYDFENTEEDVLVSVGKLLRIVPESTDGFKDVQKSHKQAAILFMEDALSDLVLQHDVFEGLDYDDDQKAYSVVEDFIAERLEVFGIKHDSSIITAISRDYDATDGLHDYFKSLSEGGSGSFADIQSSGFDEIDDLFDRS